MRWCQQHWNALRAEVKTQGLESLVPDNGERAAEIMARQLEGEQSTDAFDPLMGVHWAINSFIASNLGQGGFVTLIAYDGCPVCKADSVHDEHCTETGCTYSIANFFANAVADQRAAYEALAAAQTSD